MIVTKWVRENGYKSQCLRCGQWFWVKKGCTVDFCLICQFEMEEKKNVRRSKK